MLRNSRARIKFISAEPLLSRLNNLNPTDIDWLIVGGESDPHCRPIKKEWVEELLDLAKDNNMAFFFKQWGGFNKKKERKSVKWSSLSGLSQRLLRKKRNRHSKFYCHFIMANEYRIVFMPAWRELDS